MHDILHVLFLLLENKMIYHETLAYTTYLSKAIAARVLTEAHWTTLCRYGVILHRNAPSRQPENIQVLFLLDAV